MIYTSRNSVVYSLRSFASRILFTTSKRRQLHTQLAQIAFKLARRVLECIIRYIIILSPLALSSQSFIRMQLPFPLTMARRKIKKKEKIGNKELFETRNS